MNAFEFPGGVEVPPVHPGRTLAAELAARELTANALALKLRVPANRLSDIVRGHRAISPETALRLGRYFGTGAQFWTNLQANYDLAVARRELGATIEHEVEEEGAMIVFRLDPNPATQNDPRWQLSRVRECVWVKADDPDQARHKVALATLEFRPATPGTPIPRSPWYDDAFASCVMDRAPRPDVPDDAVIKADGTKVE